MKLFQRLLIAPAALGLLAPMAANAEVVEQKGQDLSAGAFASATKMSGGSVFTTGFIDTDANTNNNKLTSEYNYSVDLNTSFTGSDNLYVGVEAGNQDELVMDSQITGGNGLSVASLYYEFPIGDFQITAGPLFDQDDVISATTSIYSDAFRLGAMPWGAVGTTGAGLGVEYISDNGWNGSFNVLSPSAHASSSTVGLFTDESADIYTVSAGYDAANYGGGVVYTAQDVVAENDKDSSLGVGVYFRPDGFPTISIALDKFKDASAADSTDFLLGMDYEVGSGSLGAAYQARDTAGVDTANYEVYYNYPVNDGVTVQGGLFSEEVNGSDNTQGFVVETFFSF